MEICISIRLLCQFLYEVYDKKVMVFIDEYDSPFIEAHVRGYHDEIHDVLASFLQYTLKGNPYLKYAMLTGVQRVAKENVFSGLNNLDVFSVEDCEYSEYFGFTTKETKTILEAYGLQLNDDVKQMYDGYKCGGVEVYNPWSIINYAKRGILNPY